ncbi:GNAT family N-acetyltransferase [Aminipila terrae]|uniref:GNAT family N-acetyltransferase n=1 Tax=Aminipila terrae TaxID=2697030 RepID=A0A6P1MKG9_9FIRM|nr:GNAT family N-acetyltransferase [Aminipila terrae]QHI72136.1 GNAT family N-acetyltransferase [Aminipila terrae]
MTNNEILEIAMYQSATDLGCCPDDFRLHKNKVVLSGNNPDARKYLTLPFYCNLVSYGNNIVASVDSEIADIVENYINKYPVEHCFEPPNMYRLNEALEKKNMGIGLMSEYFLPDITALREIQCDYEMKILLPGDFANLYTSEWSNALCEKRKQLDVLAVAAYDKNKLIGLAGCSADCQSMWQIGIDVLPEYRRRNIASALTSRLALETIYRGKVPFYCAAWSNIRSVRNAIKSGFKPTWVEMNAQCISSISERNK